MLYSNETFTEWAGWILNIIIDMKIMNYKISFSNITQHKENYPREGTGGRAEGGGSRTRSATSR
jgi:hypothetical protein